MLGLQVDLHALRGDRVGRHGPDCRHEDTRLVQRVAQRGGAVCTSSNARVMFDWAFQREPRIFFFPDEHLGRNTGAKMAIPLDRMVVWDPAKESGGLTPAELEGARRLTAAVLGDDREEDAPGEAGQDGAEDSADVAIRRHDESGRDGEDTHACTPYAPVHVSGSGGSVKPARGPL